MLKFLQNLNSLDQCVEADIQQGDTLAKVALRYNVPISELKRVNNLLNEAEFHVLTTIKVPTKAASLLTELLPEVIVYINSFEIERATQYYLGCCHSITIIISFVIHSRLLVAP